MSTNYGKLDFAVSFNPKTAFPLDSRSYFESLSAAQTAAASATESGSSNSIYYFGQIITVFENSIATIYKIIKNGSGVGELAPIDLEIYNKLNSTSIGYSNWDSSTIYSLNDLVSYNGIFYKSLTDSNSGHDPSSDTINWQLITLTNILTTDAVTSGTGEVIGTVSQSGGKLVASKKTLVAEDIPEIPVSKVTDLNNQLDSKLESVKVNNSPAIVDNKVAIVESDSLIGDNENKVYSIHKIVDLTNWDSGVSTSNATFVGDKFFSTISGKFSVSVNGIDWQAINSIELNNSLAFVSYAGGKYFVSNSRKNSWYSDDGINWTKFSDEIGFDYVVYFNSKYYGCSPSIRTSGVYSSTDGITWTQVIESDDVFNLAASSEVLVAINMNTNYIYRTTDGTTWTDEEFGASLSHIIYGDKFILSTQSGIYYSSDASEWTKSNIDSWYLAKYYLGGKYFALSNNQDTIVSDDGQTWSNISGLPNNNSPKIVYLNGYYIISAGMSNTYISNDATNWTRVSFYGSTSLAAGNGIVVLGNSHSRITYEKHELALKSEVPDVLNKLDSIASYTPWLDSRGYMKGVIVSRNSRLYISKSESYQQDPELDTNHQYWDYISLEDILNNKIGNVSINKISSVRSDDISYSEIDRLFTDANGKAYVVVQFPDFNSAVGIPNQPIYRTYVDGLFFVVDESHRLYTSVDGEHWNANLDLTDIYPVTILHAGNRYFLASQSGVTYQSVDGQKWIIASSEVGLDNIVYWNNFWYIGTSSWSTGIYKWYERDDERFSSVYNNGVRSKITINDSTLLALDLDSGEQIFKSTNMYDWTDESINVELIDIIFGDKYIGRNSSGVYYSTDGITWTQSSIDYEVEPIQYLGGKYLTTAQYHALLYSSDGITWSEVSDYPKEGPAFGYTNGYYFMGNATRGVYYSTDLVQWTYAGDRDIYAIGSGRIMSRYDCTRTIQIKNEIAIMSNIPSPVNKLDSIAAYEDWDSTKTYKIYDSASENYTNESIVSKNGKLYRSKVNDNIGHDPELDINHDYWEEVTLGSILWKKLRLIESHAHIEPGEIFHVMDQLDGKVFLAKRSITVDDIPTLKNRLRDSAAYANWSSSSTYNLGDIVSCDGNLYRSKVNDNSVNPSSSGSSTYWDSVTISELLSDKVNSLDVSDSPVSGQLVDSVSETDGKISVHRRALTTNDIPTLNSDQIKPAKYWGLFEYSDSFEFPSYPAWVSPSISGEPYNEGDIVSMSGKLYRSLVDDNTQHPSSSAYWGMIGDDVKANDFLFLLRNDDIGNSYYDMYIVVDESGTLTWELKYTLPASSFTQTQLDAINSGITEEDVEQYLRLVEVNESYSAVEDHVGHIILNNLVADDNNEVYAKVLDIDPTKWNQTNVSSSNFSSTCYGTYVDSETGNTENLYVAASQGNKGIMYSFDGRSWFESNITSGNFYEVDYLNGVFLAGSHHNGIYYSTDGQTWTQVSSTDGLGVRSFCYASDITIGGSTYDNVLVAATNKGIYYSRYNDGSLPSTWYASYLNNYSCYSVTVGTITVDSVSKTRFVVGTYENGIYYSDNIRAWYSVSNVIGGFYVVYYSNGYYLAGSRSNRGIYYSTDGRTWTRSNRAVGYIRSIVYGNSKFVACDGDNGIYYSTNNGQTWTLVSVTSGQNYWKVIYDGTRFVATGVSTGIRYSTNGSSWSLSNVKTGKFYTLTYGNNVILAAGNTGTGIYYSSNASTWNQAPLSVSNFYSIVYGNGRFIAGSDSNHGIWYSDDGKFWYESNVTTGTFGIVYYADIPDGITISNITYYGLYLAGGYGDTTSSGLWYSVDGINWIQSNITSGNFYSIQYGLVTVSGGGYYHRFVVGYKGGIYYSSTGISWSSSSSASGDGSYVTVIYSSTNKNFIAVNSTKGIWYSTNGSSWTQVSTDSSSASLTSLKCNDAYYTKITDGLIIGGVTYTDLYLVGTSGSGMYISSDGATWTHISSYSSNSIEAFLYDQNSNILLAAGVSIGIVYYDVDTSTWKPSNVSGSVYRLFYANGKFIASGTTLTSVSVAPRSVRPSTNSNGFGILFSDNGKSWTRSDDITAGIFTALAYGRRMLVISGYGEGIYYSDTIPNMIPLAPRREYLALTGSDNPNSVQVVKGNISLAPVGSGSSCTLSIDSNVNIQLGSWDQITVGGVTLTQYIQSLIT